MNVLVTAGPTREPLDPVRFISNRSSGKMGYAVARAAASRKHKVVLVSGPVALKPPGRTRVINVVTSDDMLDAVQKNIAWCDALVMTAAVADWRPRQRSLRKLKKSGKTLKLELVQTVDILASLAKHKGRRLFVGFAAETGNPIAEAKRKLAAKKLDMIVANDVSRPDAGFEVDTNKVMFISSDGTILDLPLMSKKAIAGRIITWLEQRNKK
jgi:phosphopantothenoylcysteine decarboxylase / phosphopantothenate---cysteine ligase